MDFFITVRILWSDSKIATVRLNGFSPVEQNRNYPDETAKLKQEWQNKKERSPKAKSRLESESLSHQPPGQVSTYQAYQLSSQQPWVFWWSL